MRFVPIFLGLAMLPYAIEAWWNFYTNRDSWEHAGMAFLFTALIAGLITTVLDMSDRGIR